jgi:hypothetical protein
MDEIDGTNAYKNWIGKSQGRNCVVYLDVYGKIILKWLLKKHSVGF